MTRRGVHCFIASRLFSRSLTWNSGNFCSLAASNTDENLDLYALQMSAPAIPHEYVYETSVSAGSTTAMTDSPV